MGHEVELKLQVPPDALPDIENLPWPREHARGPVNREELVNVYFDTPKFELREHGLSLRVRSAGNRRLQTIKSVGRVKHGAVERDEWEEEISGDGPDLKRAKGTALEPFVSKRLRRKLAPVFTTKVRREAVLIGTDQADLEFAVDRGWIEANGHREPISEIEIELKRGEAGGIRDIAERVVQSVPASYGAQSKPERGYALSAGQAGSAVHRRAMTIDPRTTAGEAFTAIGLSCLDHALSNARAVRDGDAEGIHQMRVGLRRLRAAISLFKELVQGPEAETVKGELKWLTDQLGPARDFDVLIENRVRPLQQRGPIKNQMGLLAQHLANKRKFGLDKAKAAIASERYRTIGLETAFWLSDGEWTRSRGEQCANGRECSAPEFAGEILARRCKKIAKKISIIGQLDAGGRHKLRIAAKKLRYGCEFFAGLFPGQKRRRQRRRLAGILKKIQSALGTLNDIEVHKRVAAKIAHPKTPTRKQAERGFAIGFIVGEEQQLIDVCTAAARRGGRRLAKQPRFWS